jgi:N-methylhydantoinase A
MAPDAVERFHQAHRERYGHAESQRAIEVVSVRLRGIAITEKPVLANTPQFKRHKARAKDSVLIWMEERRRRVEVFDRAALEPGAAITGPAVLVEYGSTTLVPAGWGAVVDGRRSLILSSAAG